MYYVFTLFRASNYYGDSDCIGIDNCCAPVGNVNPQLGEILGMNIVFPFLVIGFMMILWAILAIIKAFQTEKF
ncbi:hypothetical protein [Pelosinus fermentans]|uniref:hypothetical protein n=1 Tax=Pelosinus fermentans TaxID=365349 RepID=UPI0002E87582|nr:hypothetical protein [Pelosinus fermentans]